MKDLGLVDREAELRKLRELAVDPPAFVIVRGRRRVGKTFLLRTALADRSTVSLQAEQQPRALQLEAFARECSRVIAGRPPLRFADWNEAFESVARVAADQGRLAVVLDEFQYLAASDPALPSIVQRVWDGWETSGTPVMLVLCGSALTFMDGLLAGDSPTFGRSTYRPVLGPLAYRDCAAFAPPRSTPSQLIERYAVLGGTPQYQRWAGPRRLRDVIEDAILAPDAPLHTDPEHLVRGEDDIRDPGPYLGALHAIARGYTRTGQIAGYLAISQQRTTMFLSRLAELGYVERWEPIEPGRSGRARGVWRIADPYLRFWFRFVLPQRSRLARGRVAEVADEIERDLSTYVGGVFEDCCRDFVGRYSDLGRDAVTLGAWWSRRRDSEIDVVGLGRRGYTLLGSCKWSTRLAGPDVLADLRRAQALLGPQAHRARLAVFSRSGFTDTLVRAAEDEGVALVEAKDLF